MIRLLGFFNWLQVLGLSLYLGGLIAIMVVVTFTIFGTVVPIELAGETMSRIFRIFATQYSFTCVAVLSVGYLGKLVIGPLRRRIRWIEGGLLAALVGVVIYMGAFLIPEMESLRQVRLANPTDSVAVAEFGSRHGASQRLFSLNVLLAAVVLGITASELARAQRTDHEKMNG